MQRGEFFFPPLPVCLMDSSPAKHVYYLYVCVHVCNCVCLLFLECVPYVAAGLSPYMLPLLPTDACHRHTWAE